jgi:hypothetical protein
VSNRRSTGRPSTSEARWWPSSEEDSGLDGIGELEFDTYVTKPIAGPDFTKVVGDVTKRGQYRTPDGESDRAPGKKRPE